MKASNKEDLKKLLRKLNHGDELAFEVLYYKYRGKVANFVKRSLPFGFDLEEVVNDVFLRIWQNKSKLDADRFEPFLFKVSRNLVIDKLRKNIDSLLYLHDNSSVEDIGINDIDLKLEEKELQEWFDDVLKGLPERRKKIFYMSRFENLSYKEIGLKLGVSENTVDTQIRRALSFIRKEVEKLRMLLLLL